MTQAKKHLGPKLLQTAAEMGIDIRPVLVGKPLLEQGPFDILLHKVRRKGDAERFYAAPWPFPTGAGHMPALSAHGRLSSQGLVRFALQLTGRAAPAA